MSIENIKELSPTLTDLLEQLKSNVLSTRKIFDQFVTLAREEEYTDDDIDMLVLHHLKGIIPKTSLRNLRKEYLLLPEPKKGQNDQNDDKKVTEESSNSSSENEDFKAFRDNKGSPTTTPDIKTAYEIKEAESTPIVGDDYNWDSEKINEYKEINEGQIPNEIPPHIILQLQQLETVQQQVKELLARNEELQTKLQDKSFEVIQKTKDTVVNGITNLEIKDRIIPVKCSYSMVTERFTVVVDVERARRMGI